MFGAAIPAHAATSVTIVTPVPTFTENTASPAFSARVVQSTSITGTLSIDITKTDFSARWTFNSGSLTNCPTTSGTATSTLANCGLSITSNTGSYTSATVYNNNSVLMITLDNGSTLTDATFVFAPSTYSTVRSAGTYNFNVLAGVPAAATVTVAAGGSTVTFMSNGAGASPTTQTASGNVALTLNPFTRTGYSFSGWATSSTGSVVYTNGAIYNFSFGTTLYAIWTANSSGGSGSSGSSDTLASTGLDGAPYLSTGAVLALAGAVLILFARRRQTR